MAATPWVSILAGDGTAQDDEHHGRSRQCAARLNRMEDKDRALPRRHSMKPAPSIGQQSLQIAIGL